MSSGASCGGHVASKVGVTLTAQWFRAPVLPSVTCCI